MSDTIECTTKKWGSSIGVVIPKEVVQREGIKPDEKIQITVKKSTLAADIWNIGPIKSSKTTQEIKDEMKKGW